MSSSVGIKNIVIVGAGPAGAITACMLAATGNPHIKITILDNRAATRRDYGLAFAADAVNAVQNILQKYFVDAKHPLVTLLNSWKGRVVSTLDIETKLAEFAKNLGVKVVRKVTIKS